MSPGKVLITARNVYGSRDAMKLLEDAGCDVEVLQSDPPFDVARLLEHSRDKNALIFTMEPTREELIEAATDLKIIARPGVGYDTVDIDACTRRKVAVTVAAGCNDQSVADFAMGLLIMNARHLMDAALACGERKWVRFIGTEVWKKTLTIVGLGRIGKNLARRALGFDMRVLAVTEPLPDDEAFARDHGIEIVDLESGLREADFVSLHTPLTPQTENLINERTIELMKEGAILLNTARGGLVDEAALAAAVRSGRLAGACVDVLRVPGEGSPSELIGVPNIIVTPHMATFAREAMARVAVSAATSVVTALQGKRPEFVVNPEIYEG
jgi:phosphoglycerate dehydrogenase-like enzyme